MSAEHQGFIRRRAYRIADNAVIDACNVTKDRFEKDNFTHIKIVKLVIKNLQRSVVLAETGYKNGL